MGMICLAISSLLSIRMLHKIYEFRFSFPKSVLKNSGAPSKVNILLEKASFRNILTTEQLQKKRGSLVNICFLCKVREDS